MFHDITSAPSYDFLIVRQHLSEKLRVGYEEGKYKATLTGAFARSRIPTIDQPTVFCKTAKTARLYVPLLHVYRLPHLLNHAMYRHLSVSHFKKWKIFEPKMNGDTPTAISPPYCCYNYIVILFIFRFLNSRCVFIIIGHYSTATVLRNN